jgi:YHS domain-containing protein
MKKNLIILVALIIGAVQVNAQTALRTKHFNVNKSNVAVSGYDVVSYFTENKAVKGNKSLAVIAEGVYYYFSTQANKDAFLKNWKAYEPQYGGWCAYAMGATNDKVEIDPETFKIVNGKLYLFYHSYFNNTLTKWNKDETNLKTKADKNWMIIFK